MHAPGAAPLCLIFRSFRSFVPLAVYGILGIYVCFVYVYGWKFGSLGSLGVVGLDVLCSVFCVLYSDMRVGVGCGWLLLYSCFSFSRRCMALEPDVGGRRFFYTVLSHSRVKMKMKLKRRVALFYFC